MATIDHSTNGVDDARKTEQSGVRGRVADAQSRVQSALGGARERTSAAGREFGSRVEDAPLAALIGGVAVGAALGALLPRTEREQQTLGPVGQRIGQAAAEAAKAAVAAGKQELGIAEPAKSPVEAVIGKALSAVTAAGSAAGQAAASTVASSKDEAATGADG